MVSLVCFAITPRGALGTACAPSFREQAGCNFARQPAGGVLTKPMKTSDNFSQSVAASHAKVQVQVRETKPWGWIAVTVFLVVAVTAGAFRLFFRQSPKLTERDTVVLANFTNATGDPVFDGTLRQGLSVQLEQSPFLSLVSEERIQQTLRLMSRPNYAQLTPEIAREVCERTGSAAVLEGSIASLGSQYVLGLRAKDCRTGNVLDEEQVQAPRKEEVLHALDQIATKFRTRVGESLTSVQNHDTPLAEATTPSLEALKAYSKGWQLLNSNQPGAIPFFTQAVEIDPQFAMAQCRARPDVRPHWRVCSCNGARSQGLRAARSRERKGKILHRRLLRGKSHRKPGEGRANLPGLVTIVFS